MAATFGPGGRIANVGVPGAGVTSHLEKLRSQNITITTRLVDGGAGILGAEVARDEALSYWKVIVVGGGSAKLTPRSAVRQRR